MIGQTTFDLLNGTNCTRVVTTRISFVRCNTDCHLDFFGGESFFEFDIFLGNRLDIHVQFISFVVQVCYLDMNVTVLLIRLQYITVGLTRRWFARASCDLIVDVIVIDSITFLLCKCICVLHCTTECLMIQIVSRRGFTCSLP